MKNICMAIFAAMMIASCVKKETPAEVNTTTESTTVEKTVVVDTVAVEPKEDGTSVKINSNGVDVDSKDVNVEIKK